MPVKSRSASLGEERRQPTSRFSAERRSSGSASSEERTLSPLDRGLIAMADGNARTEDLIAMLEDESPVARLGAVYGLLKRPTSAIVERLRRVAAEDTDPDVRDTAAWEIELLQRK